MFGSQSNAIHDFLRRQGLADPGQLEALHEEHLATGRSLADVAVDAGLITRAELLQRLAAHCGYDFIPELPLELPGEAIASVPGSLAREYGVLPVHADEENIHLALANPFNLQVVADLTFALDRNVRFSFADPDKVEARVRQHYGEDDETLDDLLRAIEAADFSGADGREWSGRELESMAEQTPIVRFVNLVFGQAIRSRASDIHFEPFEREFKIRCRVDGALYELAPPPGKLALPVTSRIKVLAGLDIAERRLPQDGRIRFQAAGHAVDLRVSTLPTQFGESVVVRVLDQSAMQLDLAELGMPGEVRTGLQEIVRRPNGIFIATGPTGSGKTTTLYSCLRYVNTVDLKLLTAEDPVEYELEGIMQVPVNPPVGLTFASALRSFLRQDPDVIMVGEIRDLETAQISIQAALTGHLVLSTLHTNDAAGAVTRLIDMGVEPFLIAAALEAVLAQRLVRRVCARCKAPYEPDAELLAQLGLRDGTGDRRFFHGLGCPACYHSGYQGRLGIYEWLRIVEPVRELITAKAPALFIRGRAVEHGMHTLRQAGLQAIFNGDTSVEEVAKCI